MFLIYLPVYSALTFKDIIMAVTIIDLLILRHYFKLGLKTTDAVSRFREVKMNKTLNKPTAQNFFKLLFKRGEWSFDTRSNIG